MRDMIERSIDGKTYHITEFPAAKGLRILTKLTKLVGEPLGILMATARTEEIGPAEEAKLLSDAVRSLLSRVEENEILSLIKILSSEDTLLCDNRQIVFDLHYKGAKGLAHLFKVVKAVLEVNYKDFLGELLAAVPSGRTGESIGEKLRSTGEYGDQSLKATGT